MLCNIVIKYGKRKGEKCDKQCIKDSNTCGIHNKNKISVNQVSLQEWLKKGNKLPVCVNIGCHKKVAIRHWTKQGKPSLKTECSSCLSSRQKNKNIENVSFLKKNYCENKSGILGFICPIDIKRYSEFSNSIYHMDHLDGNHVNNDINNIKTFCSICHTQKSILNNDYNSFKNSSQLFDK
jgi:hypothetical protein